MAKVEIVKSLYVQINKKFKQDSLRIFQHLKSLEYFPKKCKTLGYIGGILIKELKYKGFRFYFITDGYKLKYIDEETLEHCQKMNIYRISFGLESGSDKVLHILKSGVVTVEDNQKALDLCHKFGIACGGNFITGTPHENKEDVLKSYDFAIKNLENGKLLSVGTSVLTPYPGTPYWQIAQKKYKIDPSNFNWGRLDVLGFTSFWQDYNGSVDIKDWWNYRKKRDALYIGALEENEFLDTIEESEYRMNKIIGRNILEERRPHGRKEDLRLLEERLELLNNWK